MQRREKKAIISVISLPHQYPGPGGFYSLVSAEVKEEYMTLQGRLQDYSLTHCHLKFS